MTEHASDQEKIGLGAPDLSDLERALIGATTSKKDLWERIRETGIESRDLIPEMIMRGVPREQVEKRRSERGELFGIMPIFAMEGLMELDMGNDISPSLLLSSLNEYGQIARKTILTLKKRDGLPVSDPIMWKLLQVKSELKDVIAVHPPVEGHLGSLLFLDPTEKI